VTDYDQMVEDFGLKHRKQHAYWTLLFAGADATPAVRRGLQHDDPQVRVGCCKVLDHHMDADALPELMANLTHKEGEVRAWALHALACDRCKEGECRPGEDDVIPIALRMLAEDRSRRVRTQAAQMLGPSVHRRPEVAGALQRAHETDSHPVVRKVAGWYAPGGTIFERLRPKAAGR
jgi:HEAT repeat protein